MKFLYTNFLYYFNNNKYYFFNYIIIGLGSIFFELVIRAFLKQVIDFQYINLISLLFGIFFSFFFNIKFNFSIPKKYYLRTFIYFFIISLLSFLFQSTIATNYHFLKTYNYNIERLFYSALFFVIFYFIHIKISFKNSIKIGIAIYPNKKQNIEYIFNKMSNIPDFIHIDIVDDSYNPKAMKFSLIQLVKIRKLWPHSKVEVHIMSKYPSLYINKIINYVDLVYIHYEIKEPINLIESIVHKNGKDLGIVLHCVYKYKNLNTIIKKFKNILILSIKTPGESGQQFLMSSLDLIKLIKNQRLNTILTVDGGVNKRNLKNLNVDKIVSHTTLMVEKNPLNAIYEIKMSKIQK